MTRGPGSTPSRDRAALAYRIEIEAAWNRLTRLGPKCTRVACLSPVTGLISLRRPGKAEPVGAFGTYNRTVELEAFREDALHAALPRARTFQEHP